jgi:hypothetical protein
MPAFAVWFVWLLATSVGSIIISAFLSLGIGLMAGSLVEVTGLSSQIHSMMGAAGPFYDYFVFFGGDTVITIILSAWAGRALKDSLKMHLVKKPGA